ncbi:MAG: hypothetical protein GX843_03035 [Synergistaceae bacterium]|nr:hypothetical protein [Synergistaceae bacterium]
MFELLLGPAKKLLEMGIETFRKSEDLKTLTVVVQDKILRETRYNLEIFQQLLRKKVDGSFSNPEEIRLALTEAIRASAFDELDNGCIPLSFLFPLDAGKEKWPKNPEKWGDVEKYLQHTESIKTQADLLERLYHRIFLLKTYGECGKIHGDLRYICFLLMALNNSLKGSQEVDDL